ncbi:MAG TPA: ankyrin repeat domain-containing protein [Verrucomicrobiae bacterium]|jgi:ankyrin repeat protein|nr:ankyrin repeat domain-containing protein [Verrucomicrobiae bacterium]
MSASPEWYELLNHVAQRQFNEAADLLAANPSLRSAVNGIGETVLHYQAVENDERGVAWLKSKGFDINTRNEFGIPVVFEVAQLNYKDLLSWFISNGADMTCRDGEGQNIKEYLLDYENDDMMKHLESLGI